MWGNSILFTTWWGDTGGVKRVILSFLSNYSILFGITAHFPHVTPLLCRIITHFYHVTPHIDRIICHFYHVIRHFWRITQQLGKVIQHLIRKLHFHRMIVDSCKPRFTKLDLKRRVLSMQGIAISCNVHIVKIFPCVWSYAYFNAPMNYLAISISYFLNLCKRSLCILQAGRRLLNLNNLSKNIRLSGEGELFTAK